MYIKLKHSRAFCYKILNHLSCSHYLLPIYMQHLLRTDSWFFFLKKGWVDKWYFGADINLLEDRKRKKVLKISTGHKPLSYRNHKNRKSQKKKKKFQKRCTGRVPWGARLRKSPERIAHLLSFNDERSTLYFAIN